MSDVSQARSRRVDEYFWDGAAEDKLLFQRCGDCGRFRNPPRPMCPHCQSLRWEAVESTGRGTVVSYVIPRLLVPEGQERVVVLVELEEGVRIFSNLVGVELGDVRFGAPVTVAFEERLGVRVPVFVAASEG